MKLTFQEFFIVMFNQNPDSNSDILQDGWMYQVSEAIRSGQNVSDRVLNCHSEIYFDQTGIAHYRNKIKGLK